METIHSFNLQHLMSTFYSVGPVHTAGNETLFFPGELWSRRDVKQCGESQQGKEQVL